MQSHKDLADQARQIEIEHAIIEILRATAPATVVVEGGGLDPQGEELFSEEKLLIVNSVIQRQKEFRAGRIYARQALRQLGAPDAPLLRDPTRAPLWPLGTVGSISHTRHVCAVAVGRSAEFKAIGIDIEDFSSLNSHDGADLTRAVATPDELVRHAEIESALGLSIGRVLFSVKEAVYKTYAPLRRTFLDYLDVDMELDVASNAFRAKCTCINKEIAADFPDIRGRFAIYGDHVIACAHNRV